MQNRVQLRQQNQDSVNKGPSGLKAPESVHDSVGSAMADPTQKKAAPEDGLAVSRRGLPAGDFFQCLADIRQAADGFDTGILQCLELVVGHLQVDGRIL